MAPVIRADGLTRRFGPRLAVEGLTFTVSAGEVVGLLGPNGAGKTTTLRMLAGLFAPTSGRVVVTGRVGLLTEVPGLWERLSVELNLLTHARLHGLPDPRRAVLTQLDRFGLAGRAADPARVLSHGLRQRVALARALLHDPEVVLLDEPTASLDPASAHDLRQTVQQLRARGKAIVLSTHNLAEAEALSDRVAILQTTLLALDRPTGLRDAGSSCVIAIDLDQQRAADFVDTAAAAGAIELLADGSRMIFTLSDPTRIPDTVAALVGAGARVSGVERRRRTLEEVYLSLISTAEPADE